MTKNNVRKLKQEKFRLELRKNFLPGRQSELLREMPFPSVVVFKLQLDKPLSTWADDRADPALSWRIDQRDPSNLNHLVIVCSHLEATQFCHAKAVWLILCEARWTHSPELQM